MSIWAKTPKIAKKIFSRKCPFGLKIYFRAFLSTGGNLLKNWTKWTSPGEDLAISILGLSGQYGYGKKIDFLGGLGFLFLGVPGSFFVLFLTFIEVLEGLESL